MAQASEKKTSAPAKKTTGRVKSSPVTTGKDSAAKKSATSAPARKAPVTKKAPVRTSPVSDRAPTPTKTRRIVTSKPLENESAEMTLDTPSRHSGIGSTLITLLAVALVASGVYWFLSSFDKKIAENAPVAPANQESTVVPGSSTPPSPEAQASQARINSVLTKLATLILIDQGDVIQTVNVIEDVAEVQKQEPVFFKNAQNGDYILFFQSRVILYRDSDNKIINVAPIYRNGTTPPAASQTPPAPNTVPAPSTPVAPSVPVAPATTPVQ